MPVPKQNEPKSEYLTRCMGDADMNKKHKDPAQRYAICQSIYKTEKPKTDKKA